MDLRVGLEAMAIAYKLVRVRRDGSLGPLFINRRLRITPGEWLEAEDIPTKGYARRPGWHCTLAPVAPHLSTRGRQWWLVEVQGADRFQRPESQGGTWVLAQRIRFLSPIPEEASS